MYHEQNKFKVDFSTEIMEIRRQHNDTFKVLKWKGKNKKLYQARILYTAKKKKKGKIMIFRQIKTKNSKRIQCWQA